jgi:alpha-galactosidase
VNETVVRATAKAMVDKGLRDAGYTYVVRYFFFFFFFGRFVFNSVSNSFKHKLIDDCWAWKRDANGVIQADPVTFPSGIKALADYGTAKLFCKGITVNN